MHPFNPIKVIFYILCVSIHLMIYFIFNPISVLFSRNGFIEIYGVYHSFNPISVLFSRIYGKQGFGPKWFRLSILYWFYFLDPVTFRYMVLDPFQSYIGSIFSRRGNYPMRSQHHSFNPILVLFSLVFLSVFPINANIFQSYIGSIFSW